MRITLRRSAGARRLSLTVSQIDGIARLTVPSRCPKSAAESFVREHRDWLRNAVARAPEVVSLTAGSVAPYRGRPCRIVHGDRRGVHYVPPDVLSVGGPASQISQRLLVWLKEQARARLLERSEFHATALGVRFNRIVIRDTRSRWGSCSSSGALSYSWRLILAPDATLDYVAAHEVAHLIEMNHSPRFWALVEKLVPDWREHRDWLRAHGAELHRYRA